MSRQIIYTCDKCDKEIEKMVVFEATDANLKDKATYCLECSVEEFQRWIQTKLPNGKGILVVNPSVRNLQ